jgi:hypothetical protein
MISAPPWLTLTRFIMSVSFLGAFSLFVLLCSLAVFGLAVLN